MEEREERKGEDDDGMDIIKESTIGRKETIRAGTLIFFFL